MIYVYAFASAVAELPELTGLDDAPVEQREVSGMAAVVSRHADGPPDASEQSILRHARVVEELATTGAAVLPARFGTVFADDEALRRAVGELGDELRSGLDRVRGCVELGLRVLMPEQEPEAAAVATGGDYLRGRLREANERERLAAELTERLAGLARDHAHRSPPSGELLLSGAYLVPEGSVETFRRAVQELESSHPELGLICTGPWPPYSFAPTGTEAR